MGAKRINTEIFIERANIIHNYKYDYSKTVYIKASEKSIIICPQHGEFKQCLYEHLKGCGCPFCRDNRHISIEERKIILSKIHNNRYDYSKFIYEKANTKIIVICPIHGEFSIMYRNHFQGQGCKKCNKKHYLTIDSFIQKFNEIHLNRYDYSKFIFIDSFTKGIIICPLHGDFSQTPNNHYSHKSGCPKCKSSKGEILIRTWLQLKNITYIEQHYFEDCRGKRRKLPFDFWLPKDNICIEFDGKQHFEIIKRSKDSDINEQTLKRTQISDNIKNNYCKEKGIHLLRIPYTEIKNIDNILTKQFN